MNEHDCPHPIDDYGPGGADIWVCPDCKRVWEARINTWWAPVENEQGGPEYEIPPTP